MAIDQPKRENVIELLQAIYRNDETHFEHHQVRRWDGKDPHEAGFDGTIWQTPREIARNALRALGADVPDAIAEMRARVEARAGRP